MTLNLDKQRIDIACPHCSSKQTQLFGRLKRDPNHICTQCGQSYKVDTVSAQKSLKAVNDQMATFQRNLGKMFK